MLFPVSMAKLCITVASHYGIWGTHKDGKSYNAGSGPRTLLTSPVMQRAPLETKDCGNVNLAQTVLRRSLLSGG